MVYIIKDHKGDVIAERHFDVPTTALAWFDVVFNRLKEKGVEDLTLFLYDEYGNLYDELSTNQQGIT